MTFHNQKIIFRCVKNSSHSLPCTILNSNTEVTKVNFVHNDMLQELHKRFLKTCKTRAFLKLNGRLESFPGLR